MEGLLSKNGNNSVDPDDSLGDPSHFRLGVTEVIFCKTSGDRILKNKRQQKVLEV